MGSLAGRPRQNLYALELMGESDTLSPAGGRPGAAEARAVNGAGGELRCRLLWRAARWDLQVRMLRARSVHLSCRVAEPRWLGCSHGLARVSALVAAIESGDITVGAAAAKVSGR